MIVEWMLEPHPPVVENHQQKRMSMGASPSGKENHLDALLSAESAHLPLALTLSHCCSHLAWTQVTFVKLFTIEVDGDIRCARIEELLKHGPSAPASITARHVQALRADLRAETVSHAD